MQPAKILPVENGKFHEPFPHSLVGSLENECEELSATEIIGRVLERFGDRRVGLTSAFGPEGCVLVDLVHRLQPGLPVYTIDTGVLFQQSHQVVEAFRERGANVVVVEPLVTLRSQRERHGDALWRRDPDLCCEIRKVEPMRRILDRIDVWFTAVRRDQGETRRDTPVIGVAHRSDGSPVLKVAPLARWTRGDTWRHLLTRGLPYNGLLDQGYTSVGCRPCTRPTVEGEPERAGRWSGHGKTECGIHNL